VRGGVAEFSSRKISVTWGGIFHLLLFLFWGKEGILPPASSRLSRARPTGSANPLSRFHIAVCGIASASDFCIARQRRRSSFSHGRPSGNARGWNASARSISKTEAVEPSRGSGIFQQKNIRDQMQMRLTHPPVRAQDRSQRRREGCERELPRLSNFKFFAYFMLSTDLSLFEFLEFINKK